jgi:hypothetical protein
MAFIPDRMSVSRGRPPGDAFGDQRLRPRPFCISQIARIPVALLPINPAALLRPHRCSHHGEIRNRESRDPAQRNTLLGQALSLMHIPQDLAGADVVARRPALRGAAVAPDPTQPLSQCGTRTRPHISSTNRNTDTKKRVSQDRSLRRNSGRGIRARWRRAPTLS